MKLRTYVLLLCLLLHALSGIGQTAEELREIQQSTNLPALFALSEKLKAQAEEDRRKAIAYARLKGWPLTREEEDGTYMELIGVSEEGLPVYAITLNAQAAITARANKLYTGGGLDLNVHGESMTAGVWDAGKLRLTHEAYENRALQADLATSINGHSTHVAGTIMASGQYPPQYAPGAAQGMAFKANVHGYDWGNDIGELAAAAAGGLLLSNHSYTAGIQSNYSYRSASIDQIAYDAPYLLSVWAAGNFRDNNIYAATDKLSDEAVCKNGITVANVYPVVNYTGPASVIYAENSSYGPSDDLRIKPDISAKGVAVYSTGGQSNNYYTFSSGTSMAAPSVTGTLLLLQQHYNNVFGHFMKAATLKGVVLHTADEAGPDPGPDINYGWGLINAERAAKAISTAVSGGSSILAEADLANSGTFSQTVTALGNNKPLVITLCWTDMPGAVSVNNNITSRLINDLDLRVTSGATTYYPWKLDPANSSAAAIQGDNIRDNVEKIEIPNPIAGQPYTITINHKGILQNNVQPYSLIVTGISTDECQPYLLISSDVPSGNADYKQAGINIKATNTVGSTAEAAYHAEDEVLLAEGFTALGGSAVRAYIQGCTNSYVPLAEQNRAVVTYDVNDSGTMIPETIDKDNALQITPNPNHGAFTIFIPYEGEGALLVTALDGRTILKQKITGNRQFTINIGKEPTGVYLVQATIGDRIINRKMLKQ